MREPVFPAPRDAGDDESTTPSSPTPRRQRRLVVAVLIGLVLVAAGWTAIAAVIAAQRLKDVRSDLSQLRANHGDRAELERAVERDLRKVDSTRSLLRQPGPAVVSFVPVIGRNVRGERTVADASRDALRAGLTLLRSTDGLSNGSGGVDLTRLADAATSLDTAGRDVAPSLASLAEAKTGWTLPPVGDGVRQARNLLLGLDTRLQHGAAALQALHGVLGGNGRRTVFVGLTNNAELRGTQGLLAGYATGVLQDGNVTLRPFADVTDIAQPPSRAQRVPAPADLHDAYGFYLADTTLWKNITMSPRGDETAQVVAEAAAASLHVRPDVVVLLDVPATAAIVSATGPIRVGGREVTGDELLRRLLVDAYESGSLSQTAQRRRHDLLNAAATQAVDRLKRSGSASPALLNALSSAASGRHLVVWSARSDEEHALTVAGAGGAVDATGRDIAMVTGNNLGDAPGYGNKIDYYVNRRLRMDVRLEPSHADVTQTLTLRNGVNLQRGPYVIGARHPGLLTELLSMAVPAAAQLSGFTQDGRAVDVSVAVAGDGSRRLTTVLKLPAGAMTTFQVTYRLPVKHGRYNLLLVPQPLAHDAELDLRIHAHDAALGVTSGIHQPRGDVVTMSGPWTSVTDIVVPVHPLGGLRGVLHAIAHFWTHKI